MIFKFPKKKIVLDCFTSEEYILRTASIDYAIKHTPQWWRDLPSSVLSSDGFTFAATAKGCVGISEYYKNSVIIPLWSDLAIQTDPSGSYRWKFSDETSEIDVHDFKTQAPNLLPNYGHLKLVSPWLFKTNENIKWVWSHPIYSFPNSNDVVTFPAVVSYKHQHTTNINLMVNTTKSQIILIGQGQPMCHITPMSDRKVKIVRHLVSQKEYKRINSLTTQISFFKKYQTIIKRTEQFKTCPFKDHTK